jgi:hypothetical protein
VAAGILSAVGAILSSDSSDPAVLTKISDAQLGHPASPAEASAITTALNAMVQSHDPQILAEMTRLKGHRIYGHRIY